MGRTIIGISTANAMAHKYRDGASLNQLAREYGVTSNSVREHLIRLRVDRRPIGSHRRATPSAAPDLSSTPDHCVQPVEDLQQRSDD